MSYAIQLPFAAYPGHGRELLGRSHGDVARHGYARDILGWCDQECVYCELDMSTFEGWLQLSVDHVVPVGVKNPDSRHSTARAIANLGS